MRVLVAQINPTIGDLEGNTKKILDSLQFAREKKIDIVLCPELAVCGYPPEDLVLHSSFIDAMEGCLEKIMHASKGLVAIVGLVRRNLHSGASPFSIAQRSSTMASWSASRTRFCFRPTTSSMKGAISNPALRFILGC